MTHIQLLGTGGTIASRDSGGTGSVATDAATDLARAEYGELRVTARDVLTTNSYRLTLGDLRLIAEATQEALVDRGNDGVVVTHGTDTLEETAFLLDLVHRSPKTVVLTGSQQPADSPAPDGPRNVEEAVLAAASPGLHNSGVLISFNGTVRSARGARKAHTTASSPFQGGAEVAHMAGDELVVTATPQRHHPPLPLPSAAFDTTRVEIVTAYPGATPDLLDFAVQFGAQAVVLAGTGVGNAGPGFAENVAQAVESGCAVVLSTRAPWGPVVPLYGNGGGTDLVAAGAIPSGDLNPFQARILAALLLSHGTPAAELPWAFRAHL
ncbi:L-asparaginase [Kocuria dechangensis]|uniref:asparaginase n=1 Tax=Kocuria dechangensis TaxID=1176249 RepID=A0A917H541_9MICC|nr:asparaginase [Kocuria dechangensis]GGG67864.1 L-asparaginase [Kocuria dechangensis]